MWDRVIENRDRKWLAFQLPVCEEEEEKGQGMDGLGVRGPDPAWGRTAEVWLPSKGHLSALSCLWQLQVRFWKVRRKYSVVLSGDS